MRTASGSSDGFCMMTPGIPWMCRMNHSVSHIDGIQGSYESTVFVCRFSRPVIFHTVT